MHLLLCLSQAKWITSTCATVRPVKSLVSWSMLMISWLIFGRLRIAWLGIGRTRLRRGDTKVLSRGLKYNAQSLSWLQPTVTSILKRLWFTSRISSRESFLAPEQDCLLHLYLASEKLVPTLIPQRFQDILTYTPLPFHEKGSNNIGATRKRQIELAELACIQRKIPFLWSSMMIWHLRPLQLWMVSLSRPILSRTFDEVYLFAQNHPCDVALGGVTGACLYLLHRAWEPFCKISLGLNLHRRRLKIDGVIPITTMIFRTRTLATQHCHRTVAPAPFKMH